MTWEECASRELSSKKLSSNIRLAVVVSHPIQYHAPLYKELVAMCNLELKVFFTWGGGKEKKFDPGFGKQIEWDIPLLEGYSHEFVTNTSRDSGTHHFFGLVNPTLYQSVMAWQPDVVLVNGYNYFSHLTGMMRWSHSGLPVLFRGDSHLLSPRASFKKTLRKIVLTKLFKRIAGCLYCGTYNKKYFQEFGVANDRLFFVPHSVDNDRFIGEGKQYRVEAAALRQQIGILPEDVVVLFVGKFQKKKMPLDLLNAFKQLNIPNARLVFVGNGELESTLRSEASSLGDRVVFLPFQNQSRMPIIYRLGDVFVLPSDRDETWGLSVNEAMCCGLPIIVSDQVGCAPDLVQAGVNGYIYAAGNISSLAACLSDVTSNRSKLGQMGLRSSEFIQSWGIDATRDGILTACQAVKR